MKNDFKVKEFFVVVLTAVISMTVGFLYGWMKNPEIQKIIATMSKDDADFYMTPILMEICCVFYSTLYFTGQYLARHIGDHESAAGLEAASKSHMRLLHFMSGAYIIASTLFFKHGAQLFDWRTYISLLTGAGVFTIAAVQKKMPGWRAIFKGVV